MVFGLLLSIQFIVWIILWPLWEDWFQSVRLGSQWILKLRLKHPWFGVFMKALRCNYRIIYVHQKRCSPDHAICFNQSFLIDDANRIIEVLRMYVCITIFGAATFFKVLSCQNGLFHVFWKVHYWIYLLRNDLNWHKFGQVSRVKQIIE